MSVTAKQPCDLVGNLHDEERDFTVARQLNKQISEIESRNNQTVVGARPLTLGFDISSACNANCIFCLAEKARKPKSSPEAFRSPDWLDNFAGLLPFITQGIFSSYEALLNPDFPEFVKKLREYYTPFQIFTNGKALTPEVSEMCLRNGMNSLHCSFHSPDPHTYEGIMRGLSFDETLSNLMHLRMQAKRHNPAFTLVMVFCAMRRNITQLSDYVDLARRVGAKVIQVNYLLVTDEKHGLDHESMYFHQNLYDHHVITAAKKAASYGIRLQYQPLFSAHNPEKQALAPCYKPWEHLIVNQKGDVTICCGGSGALGNIFKQDFFEVWNAKPFRTFRRLVNSDTPPENCKKCTRGRENPHAVTTHLTYMKSMTEEERMERVREIQASLS